MWNRRYSLIIHFLVLTTFCLMSCAKHDNHHKHKSDRKTDKHREVEADESLTLGRFDLTSSMRAEDFNDFLKAMEFSDRDREMARSIHSVQVEIKRDGKYYVFSIYIPVKLMESRFELGKEFPDKLFDGRKLTALVYMISSTTAMRNETYTHFEAYHTAEFSSDGFKAEYNVVKGHKVTTAKQNFKRINKSDGGIAVDFFRALLG